MKKKWNEKSSKIISFVVYRYVFMFLRIFFAEKSKYLGYYDIFDNYTLKI